MMTFFLDKLGDGMEELMSRETSNRGRSYQR